MNATVPADDTFYTKTTALSPLSWVYKAQQLQKCRRRKPL